mgnify:CR=1 FL=1|jgi:hypothetical protein
MADIKNIFAACAASTMQQAINDAIVEMMKQLFDIQMQKVSTWYKLGINVPQHFEEK